MPIVFFWTTLSLSYIEGGIKVLIQSADIDVSPARQKYAVSVRESLENATQSHCLKRHLLHNKLIGSTANVVSINSIGFFLSLKATQRTLCMIRDSLRNEKILCWELKVNIPRNSEY
jgi:hypothetical protein